MLTAAIRMTGFALFLATGLAGCENFLKPKPQVQPETAASTVTSTPYGPRQPSSGFVEGTVPIAGNSGVFGTDDEIGIDDAGPFADNAYAPDPSLDDRSGADLAGLGADYSGDAALLAGISLPGDDGSTSYFDTEVGATVYFDTDSSELTEETREVLRRQGAWLQLHPDVGATVEGHADERGTRQYNLALGERRASAVRGYLIALGIDPGRLRKISYGSERPAVPGSDPEAWAQNRRAMTVPEPGGLLSVETPRAAEPAPAPPSDNLYADDPLLDPSLDALLGAEPAADPLSGDIPDNPVLERIESGS